MEPAIDAVSEYDSITSDEDTVSDRIDAARATLSPTRMGVGLLGVTLGLFLLLFLQEPLVHDAMHNGRHVAGVVCH